MNNLSTRFRAAHRSAATLPPIGDEVVAGREYGKDGLTLIVLRTPFSQGKSASTQQTVDRKAFVK